MGYLYRRKNDRGKALEAYSEVEAIINSDETLLSAQIILGRTSRFGRLNVLESMHSGIRTNRSCR